MAEQSRGHPFGCWLYDLVNKIFKHLIFMPIGSMILITGIQCYLDRTKQRQMSGFPCRLSFPDVPQGLAGGQRLCRQAEQAATHRQQAAGSWDLSCGRLVPTPETQHLRTVLKVSTTRGAVIPNKTSAVRDRHCTGFLTLFFHTQKNTLIISPH